MLFVQQVLLLFTCLVDCSFSTLVGYDIEEVLTTKIYSLLPSEQCTPDKLSTKNITFGGLVLHAPEVDIQMSFCMFQASYAVTGLAHSARFDDSVYLKEYSRLVPTFYALETWVCRAIWSGRNFKLPGFADENFKMTEGDLLFDGRPYKPGNFKVFDYSYSFMRGGKKAGIYFTWPVDWITPGGSKIHASGVINAKLTIGKVVATLDKTSSPWSLILTDPNERSTSCSFPGSDFQHDSITYLPHFYGQCEIKSIFEFSPEHPGVQISSADSMYLSGKTASRDDSRVFYIELLNTTVSVCSYKVRPTTYSGVYFVIEPITEQLPEIDYNTDAIPNLVYGTKIEFVHVNAHLSRQRIVNFIKNEICNTRQMILNGLISLASNLDNPNLFLGSGSMLGIHAEKAGAVLYVHKCVKVEARIADFPYCTEEVPVLLGNDTQIRFMNPITQVVYPNYTLTACDPIAPYMYRTSEGIWMHYGDDYSVARTPESLSVFSHLDFSDNLPSLHTAGLFSYQNLRQSAKARVLKYSRRTISGREVYLGPRSQYSHPGLMHFNPSVSEELENLAAWKYLIDLQSVASGGWYYAERCTVITLTTLALLGLFIYILKLVFALRLLSHGVPFWTVFRLLNPLAPFTQMLQNHINNIHASAPDNHDQLVNETDGNPDNRTVIVDSIYPSAQLNSARYTTKI